MKKFIQINLLIGIIFLGGILIAFASEKNDENWYMWHGNQDALVLGEITEIEDTLVHMHVQKRLSGKGIIDDSFRQIPDEYIADNIVIKDVENYKMSYFGNIKPEIGDYIVVSIDREGDIWSANWPPFEVNSMEYENVEFLPQNQENGLSFAWNTFVRTDGKMNDFMFVKTEDGEQVIGRGVFDDGKEVEEIIYESATTDLEVYVRTKVKVGTVGVIIVCLIVGIVIKNFSFNKM